MPQKPEKVKDKCYDKEESFFDKLEIASKGALMQETKNYNEKNKDTFQLTGEQDQKFYYPHKKGYGNYNRGNYQGGGYRGRGGRRGRGNYQGGYGNYGNVNQGGNYRGNRGGWNQRGRGRGNSCLICIG